MFKELMAKVLAYLRARLSEKSTYVSIAGAFAVHFGLADDYLEPLEQILAEGGALLSAFIPMKKVNPNKVSSPAWVFVLTLALLLGGCGAMGMNKQQYAGLNYVFLETGPGCSEGSAEGSCTVKMIDGKETASVSVKVILADGTTYEYTAGDVAAFEGQATRADVDKAAVKAVTGVVKDVIDAVKPKVPE